MVRRFAVALIAAGCVGAGPAMAAPPNDSPAGAGVFSPYTAPNGVPSQQEASADLGTATADPGVPRCLGSASFGRTVWYRIPEATTARELTVEAVGSTTAPLDLAAFVQPAITPVPTPVPTAAPTAAPTAVAAQASSVNTSEPNQCDGRGAGASGDAPDHTPAVTMLVPALRPVLIQVGDRGTPAGDSALVTLEQAVVTLASPPSGDHASAAPRLHSGSNFVDLAGATITDEDPAEPPCPNLGTVWRKYVPGSSGLREIEVSGNAASTFTVFQGSRPTGDNVLDCVDREANGSMQMLVPVTRGKPTWVRVGVDTFSGDEEATVTVKDGTHFTVVDGGPGGFDPTPFGAGGGFPSECDTADVTEAKVSGPSLSGLAASYNQSVRVPLRIHVSGSPVCDAAVRLYGPGGHIYAKGTYVRLATGSTKLAVPRLRTFVKGRYFLKVAGLDARDNRRGAPTSLTGRLTAPKKKKKRKKHK